LRKDAPFFVLLAGLSLLATWPLVLHLGDHFGHDAYDPSYCVWAMNWTTQTVAAHPAALPDGNIFYPHRGTLFFADAVIGLALLGAPFALITGNPVFAHNILSILSFWIAGWGMYLLARRLVGSRPAAAAAGLIFAFFPYNFSHIMHLELLFYGWIPFVLLFLHRLFDQPTRRNVFGAGFFFVLQVACCAYYAEYLILLTGFLSLYLFLRDGRWRSGAIWGRLAELAAIIAVFVGPYFYLYWRIHQRMLFERPLWEVTKYSSELQSILTPPSWNLIWGWLAGRAMGQEELIYPGIVPLALTVIWLVFLRRTAKARRSPDPDGAPRSKRRVWDILNAVLFLFVVVVGLGGGFAAKFAGIKISIRSLSNPVLILALSVALRILTDRRLRRAWADFFRAMSPIQRFYSGLVFVSWLLTCGPVIRIFGRDIVAGPYAFLYDWVPGFKGLRVPSRFVVLMVLGMSILGAFALAGLLAKLKSGRARAVLIGVVGVVLAADFAYGPIPLVEVETARTIPPIYAEVKKLPAEAVLIELPMPASDAEESEDVLPVYRSIFHGRRIVNGYSGYAPPAYRIVREAMERFPDRRSLDLLENLKVGYILIHTSGYRADKGRETAGRMSLFARRASPIAETGGDFLFRLEPWRSVHEKEAPVPPPPPRIVGDRSLWRAQASLNSPAAGLAFDGDPATAWSTGYPQREGDFFALDLGRTESFSRIEMRLQNNPLDFPRSFVVEVSPDGRTWRTIERDSAYFPDLAAETVDDFSTYSVPAIFAPTEARYVRIRLTGGHASRHWSIAEIILRGE
jgi:hypothetical protein